MVRGAVMSKWYELLLERVQENEIIEKVEGVNGLIAVTNSNVYLVRGAFLEKKVVKTYAIKNITSIETRRPGMMTNGHFQIISSGNSDNTKRNSSVFDYVKDENTIMIRDGYEDFLKIERVIYDLRDKPSESTTKIEDDVFTKIEKLSKLKDQNLITEEEFETKRKELLEKI
jgi:hypothetical protein